MGGNGTGKTTTISLISGLNKPYRGEVRIFGKSADQIRADEKFNGMLGVLPQNPQSIFVKKTVELDLYEMLKGRRLSKEECIRRVMKVSHMCRLTEFMDRHPYDLSGGEQQRAALAKVLLTNPRLLLLDEPTKGMDAEFKRVFAGIIRNLMREGVAVLMISHDIEFCASYASRCALFFDGSIVTEGEPRKFFSGNNFYTTAANRMSRHLIPNAVTAEDVIKACGKEVSNGNSYDYEIEYEQNDVEEEKLIEDNEKKNNKVRYMRYMLAFVSLFILIFSAQKAYPLISDYAWSAFKGAGSIDERSYGAIQWQDAAAVISFVCSIIVFSLSVFQRSTPPPKSVIQVEKDKRKLSKRTVAAAVLILLFIPLTIFIGVYYLDDKKYYFISLLIIFQTMVPFAMIFEGRNPQAESLL